MLDQRLAVNPLAQRAGPANRLVRRLAGDVHDIERHAGRVGDHDGAVGRLALHLGRTRKSVALRPGRAGLHVFLLQAGDDVAVLGMHQRGRAERARAAGAWTSTVDSRMPARH